MLIWTFSYLESRISIGYLSKLRELKLFSVVIQGEHAGQIEITFYGAKSISIESQNIMNMQIDGEISAR